jgi:hypothetical protein
MAKKVVLAVALVLGFGLARPLPAAAHTSFSVGVWFPGFSFVVADPPPPPAYYYPPAPVYYAPAAPVYYAPAPVVVRRYAPAWGRAKYHKHHGWRGHKRYRY